jgi:hypothetical protein
MKLLQIFDAAFDVDSGQIKILAVFAFGRQFETTGSTGNTIEEDAIDADRNQLPEAITIAVTFAQFGKYMVAIR